MFHYHCLRSGGTHPHQEEGEFQSQMLYGHSSRIPTENTIRYHTDKLDMEWMEGRKYIVTVDLTNKPYYERKVEKNENYVVGGKQKKSTNRFYRYSSLYIV